MGFDIKWLVFVCLLPATVWGQEPIPPARTILDISQGEQTAFINRTMDLGFPQDRADQMTMLIINLSAITLPLIDAKVEEALKSPSTPKGFVDTASEMIAYSGDEQALRVISKLMALDEKRFAPLVGRTLDNASNWRNPFSVAYRGFEIDDETVSRHISAWAESALASPRVQRAWAESLLERYGKVPGESELASDPIAFRLKNGPSPELRQNVVRFATEAQRRRELR